ncbi:unnamed protein product [Lymnaea stagnalis]|uniref:EF-hand domain-containing protein n=1 Tax=Lymnaea stagnalis TaxID=6523 RepID=A0AAV2HQR0_LYMST
MQILFIVVVALCSGTGAQPFNANDVLGRLFKLYAGDDNLFQQSEFSRFWLHFDLDFDGQVSKQEFDSGWKQEGLPGSQNAPTFFTELDRVRDEVLNSQDFPHIFRLFDENGDGSISVLEMLYNGSAYFGDVD